jgi:hypothetical protein
VRTERGLLVRVEDLHGRTSTRTVSNAETSACVIESWARSELDAPALEPGESWEAVVPHARTEAKPRSEERPLAASSAVDDVASDGAIAVSAGGELARSLHSGAWAGVRADACFRLGAFCLGLSAQVMKMVAAPSQRSGLFLAPDLDDSVDTQLLGSLALPIEMGSFVVEPAIGLGAGMRFEDRGGRDFARPLEPRARLEAALLYPISERFALRFGADAELSAGPPLDRVLLTDHGELSVSLGLNLGLRWGAL